MVSLLDSGCACRKLLQKKSPVGNHYGSHGTWHFLDPWDVVGLRTTTGIWNVPKKYGPHGELFFFMKKKETVVLREMVDFGQCIPVEKMKACAMCVLRMMAERPSGRVEEITSMSSGGMS